MVKFSIVIPTYNRADFIGNTIRYVLKQEYQNFEILVIDDGSTDNTQEIVESIKDNRIQYLKKENGERAKARNYGADRATGDYINFFDSDDSLYTNHLAEALRMIQEHNNPEVFHLNYDAVDGSNGKVISYSKLIEGELNIQLVKRGNLLSCNGVFLRKDIALLNRFNEDRALSASEDYELWLRLAARYPINYSNTITSSIINHDLRSVLNFNNDKLIKRLALFIHHIHSDKIFSEKYGAYKNLMVAHSFSYIALHVALTGKNKITSIRFLIKAVFKSRSVLLTKRFYSIIYKNLTTF